MKYKPFVFLCQFISLLFFLALNVQAASFGISPSVVETTIARGERATVAVEISRANPDRDVLLSVMTRDDSTGAIELIDGPQIVLPLGEPVVIYNFVVNADLIGEEGLLDAGIEFKNIVPENIDDVGGAHVLLAAVMKIRVFIGDASQEVQESITPQLFDPSTSNFSFPVDRLFFGIALLGLCVCLGIWKFAKHDAWAPSIFLLSSLSFLVAILGWGVSSLNIPLSYFKHVNTPIHLRTGQFFLGIAPQKEIQVINVQSHSTQNLSGEWRFMVTQSDRMYVLPNTAIQRNQFNNRLFRFESETIRPYDFGNLPGLVQSVTEQSKGFYAVFSGIDENLHTFWCLAEILESTQISCNFLQDFVSEQIVAVEFVQSSPNELLIQTDKDHWYHYDIWRKKLQSTSDMFQKKVPFELTQALEPKTKSHFGFVQLDHLWFFVGPHKTFSYLEEGLWLEYAQTKQGITYSVIDTRSKSRFELWKSSFDAELYWLQKGGFMTRP